MQLMLVAAVALVAPDGRVLVQRRPGGKSLAGLWEFPGGKVESGETPECALRREIVEELGVEVGAIAPLGFASERLDEAHLILMLYSCRQWTGNPSALHADELKWVRPGELEGLAMPPADAPLVRAVIERL